MIELTRINKEKFILNCEQIEYIETNHETIISLCSGRKMTVIETSKQIKELVTEYKKSIYNS